MERSKLDPNFEVELAFAYHKPKISNIYIITIHANDVGKGLVEPGGGVQLKEGSS